MFEKYAKSKSYKNREEWLKNRDVGIGGSESSIVLGKNPFKDLKALWREKKGIDKPKDISNKPAIVLGNQMEPIIRDKLRIKYSTLYEIKELNETYYSLEKPFMLANLDGILIDKNESENIIGLEIKTTTVKNEYDFKEKWEELCDMYYIQVQHYMYVTGIKKFLVHLVAFDWNLNEYVKEYWIERDEEDIEIIKNKVEEFYNSLKGDIEPIRMVKFEI